MFAFSQGLLLGCFGWFGNGTIIFNMNPTILVFLPKLASVQTCLTFSNEGKMQIAKAPIVWHGMIQINEEEYHLVPACRELKENTRKISSDMFTGSHQHLKLKSLKPPWGAESIWKVMDFPWSTLTHLPTASCIVSPTWQVKFWRRDRPCMPRDWHMPLLAPIMEVGKQISPRLVPFIYCHSLKKWKIIFPLRWLWEEGCVQATVQYRWIKRASRDESPHGQRPP